MSWAGYGAGFFTCPVWDRPQGLLPWPGHVLSEGAFLRPQVLLPWPGHVLTEGASLRPLVLLPWPGYVLSEGAFLRPQGLLPWPGHMHTQCQDGHLFRRRLKVVCTVQRCAWAWTTGIRQGGGSLLRNLTAGQPSCHEKGKAVKTTAAAAAAAKYSTE